MQTPPPPPKSTSLIRLHNTSPSAHQEKRALLDPRSKADFKAGRRAKESTLPLLRGGGGGASFHLRHGAQQEMCHVVFSICEDRSYVPPRPVCDMHAPSPPPAPPRMHLELNPAKLKWLFFTFFLFVFFCPQYVVRNVGERKKNGK